MKIILLILLFQFNLSASSLESPIGINYEEFHYFLGTEPADNEIINAGVTLYQWIELINSNSEEPLRLSNPNNRHGIPITSPHVYSDILLQEEFNKLKTEAPIAFLEPLLGNAELSSELPMNREDFLFFARKVNKLYQNSIRWNSLLDFLPFLKRKRSLDVRGYHFLISNSNGDIDSYLSNYSIYEPEEQHLIQEALIGLCINSQMNKSYCSNKLSKYLKESNILAYKDKYFSNSEKVYKSFFKVDYPRTDIYWIDENTMALDFKDPGSQKFRDFLKQNIEDEFKWGKWKFVLNFVKSGTGLPKLIFKAGVVPQVRGGNTIVMDKNLPIEEYSVRWTIRHEFGHILRLPDCYVEFFDEDLEAMINYQLDTTDLMCSRAGNMNQRIYEELTKVYPRP